MSRFESTVRWKIRKALGVGYWRTCTQLQGWHHTDYLIYTWVTHFHESRTSCLTSLQRAVDKGFDPWNRIQRQSARQQRSLSVAREKMLSPVLGALFMSRATAEHTHQILVEIRFNIRSKRLCLHRVRKKVPLNFAKCWEIFKILSPTDLAVSF